MSVPGRATVAVLGCGSWGTALAILLCRHGHEARLWGHEAAQIDALCRDRENRQFLPGFALPDNLYPTTSLDAALDQADDCLVVVPSHAFAIVMQQVSLRLPASRGLAWATKGLDPSSGALLHEVARAALGDRPLAVVSGPSFAQEVARGLPTAVTVAAEDGAFARRIALLLHGDRFRAYTSTDMIGVEICGAAMAELIRLGTALGGRTETFMGLAGIGDLVLTCTDNQSRNRRMGLALADGEGLAEAQRRIGQEVEGVITAQTIHRLAGRLGVEMPISEQVYRVLYEGVSPADATLALLERDPKPEFA